MWNIWIFKNKWIFMNKNKWIFTSKVNIFMSKLIINEQINIWIF